MFTKLAIYSMLARGIVRFAEYLWDRSEVSPPEVISPGSDQQRSEVDAGAMRERPPFPVEFGSRLPPTKTIPTLSFHVFSQGL